MKIALLCAFLTFLGVSLAAGIEGTGAQNSVAELIANFEAQQIQVIAGGKGIPTGADKMVKDLVELYEKHTGQPTDDSIAGSDAWSTESNYGSNEEVEQDKMNPGMKEDIAQIESVFKSAVSPAYEGMSNRKLWRELMKKQKQLVVARTQLQHLINIKQEKLNKLHKKPSRYNVPSKELSKAILRDINVVTSYKPVNLNP